LNSVGHKLYGTAASSGLYKLSVLANRLEKLDVFELSNVSVMSEEIKNEIDLVLQMIEKIR